MDPSTKSFDTNNHASNFPHHQSIPFQTPNNPPLSSHLHIQPQPPSSSLHATQDETSYQHQTQPPSCSSNHSAHNQSISSHHHIDHPHHHTSSYQHHHESTHETNHSHQPRKNSKSLRLSCDAAVDDMLSPNQHTDNKLYHPNSDNKHHHLDHPLTNEKSSNAKHPTTESDDGVLAENNKTHAFSHRQDKPIDFSDQPYNSSISQTFQQNKEEKQNLINSKSHSNKENKISIKQKNSPSLELSSADKTFLSKSVKIPSHTQSRRIPSQDFGDLPHHALTPKQKLEYKKLKLERRRKRWLWFAFMLSMFATILWLVVFCCNGWFVREFPTKRYYDYINQTDNKLEKTKSQKQNKLYDLYNLAVSNMVEGKLKQKTHNGSKRLTAKKRITFTAQYGGIWRMCSTYKEVTEYRCSSLQQYPNSESRKEKANSDDVITFRRSCAAMGIISIVILIFTNSFVYYSIIQQRYVYKRLSGTLLIGGAACILVCLEIFQGLLSREQEQVYQQTTAAFGPCYILAWLCLLILLAASVVIFYHSRKQKYTSEYDQPVIIGRF